MSIPRLFLLIILFMMSSCNSKEQADLIVVNALVYLVDENFSVAQSFAVQDGRIVATGTTGEITAQYISENIFDAQGKYIYPGFNDAHCHFTGYGINLLQYADLQGTSSPEEIYSLLEDHHQKYNGKWILGRGWDQNDWELSEFPDKKRLDELFPDVPVYLVRVDGHAGWCNSKALELANLGAAGSIKGGRIEIKNGEPTGILIDNAMSLVSKHIPEIEDEQLKLALTEAQKKCFAAGLTSVTDCGVDKKDILLIRELQEQGQLKIRINAMINPTEENFESFVRAGIIKEERLVVNTIKLFADGALGSRGALLLEDYEDDAGNNGIQIIHQSYFDSICQIASDNNFIVATHAIGDGGNRMVLDTYSRFLKGPNDRRWRVEHAQIVDPGDFEKFAAYSIIPSIQATHCTSDMGWVEERLGKERLAGAYAYQTLLKQNGWLPNGTDFPVEDINPLFTFYASVFRTSRDNQPDGGWRKEEGLSREQALRSMTIWAAKASFEEKHKGNLEQGKYADFVVLDTDIIVALPEEVLNAKVESTWIAGERVYDARQ